MLIILLAGLSMLVQDILGVLEVQAEARNKADLAGALDALVSVISIFIMAVAVSALQGHSLTEKIWILTVVAISNFIGSWLGVKIGKKFIKSD